MTAPVIRHVYRPRGAAREIMTRRESEVLMSGPAGTGKSRACLEKLHFACLKTPGVRALMVRKTLASMTSSGLVTYQEHVAKESITAGHVTWFGGSQREPPAWKYANGSVLVVGGMDKASKHMSTEYDLIYVQEAIELTKDDWEALTTRLRNGRLSFQQLLADTNPDKETHWLNRRCIDGTTVMLESRHEDNPVYFDENREMTEAGRAYIEGKLDKLTGLRRLRLRHGKWVSAEGVIFDGFDRAVHVVDRFDIPEDWTRYWAVDFGFVHPFACQWWAEDPDGRLYLYREILHTKRLVEDHARTMLRAVTRLLPGEQDEGADGHANEILASLAAGRREWTEPRPRSVICDHDAEDRATLERHLGLGTVAAKKTVSDGIQAVAARLVVQADGRPRLQLLRDSLLEEDQDLVDAEHPTCLADEIPGYVWDTADGRKPKDQPLKILDDADDTMRYVVAELDLAGRPRVRWL
ncbi:phage terminase large subunit [Amycolatopsis sp. NPDC001319]|uniref:phage terminase large subunit n=1 Tax=unclassified Amycolatopsis TaxID=2618356 RepID=UPI00368EED2D